MNRSSSDDFLRLMQLNYPLYAEPWFIFIFFCVSLVLLHFVLLWLIKDDVLMWHKLDYIWLPMALIGLLGQVQSNKVEIGKNISVFWLNQEDAKVRELNRLVNDRSIDGEYPCIKGVRSEYSPPPQVFDAIDNDRQGVCDWYRSLKPFVPTTRAGLDDFVRKQLPEPPKLSGPSGFGLKETVQDFNETLTSLKVAHSMSERNREEMNYSGWLGVLKMFSPLIICIALAIRITKVTGEGRLKKPKTPAI